MAEKKFKGIDKKTAVELEELKDTLAENPQFEKVYFTKTGAHYFQAHELLEKGKPTGKFYGWLKCVPKVFKIVGEKKHFKNESIHTPASFIIQEMTADEVLDYEFVETVKEAIPSDTRKAARQNKKKQQKEELESLNSVNA